MDDPMSISGCREPYVYYGGFAGVNIKKTEQLAEDIIQGRMEAIERDVNEIFREIHAAGADCRLVRLYRDYLQLMLLRYAEEASGISRQEALAFISEHDFNPKGMKGSRFLFKRFAFDFAEYRLRLSGQDTAGLLLQIEKDIRINYMQDISLKSLSEKYYISRPYLGQIFRKQFGICFKDFLNRVRIENAERLLLQTDEKIYNIAVMVGYRNSDYFINKFTAAKGATPARFRRQIQNK